MFVSCVLSCQKTGCVNVGPINCYTVCASSRYAPPLALKLTQWSCETDCQYHCMQAIELHKKSIGDRLIEKYNGKWPFHRILGFQELASSLFSVLNLVAHVHCMLCLRRHLLSIQEEGKYCYSWLWFTYSGLSVNAWLWSTVFHARDTHCTEKFDYLSAIAVVLFSCAAAVIRTLNLQRPRQQLLVVGLTSVLYLRHCYHMLFVKFDYGYNMAVCIAAGALGAVMWLAFCYAVPHPGRKVLLSFIASVYVAMLFEVLDFPPVMGLIDAHCMWHALTVPLVYLWYRFVYADIGHVLLHKD
jgi:post-GPI attachment to proteins factor 3